MTLKLLKGHHIIDLRDDEDTLLRVKSLQNLAADCNPTPDLSPFVPIENVSRLSERGGGAFSAVALSTLPSLVSDVGGVNNLRDRNKTLNPSS